MTIAPDAPEDSDHDSEGKAAEVGDRREEWVPLVPLQSDPSSLDAERLANGPHGGYCRQQWHHQTHERAKQSTVVVARDETLSKSRILDSLRQPMVLNDVHLVLTAYLEEMSLYPAMSTVDPLLLARWARWRTPSLIQYQRKAPVNIVWRSVR